MEILLALAAAGTYGVADYCGGRATRSLSAITVTAIGQTAGLVTVLFIVLIQGTPLPPVSDWLLGGLAGVIGATGLLSFYKAMASGFMRVSAPISAVTAASLPVIVGLSTGERPGLLALIGIPLALVSIVMVSDMFGPGHRRPPRAVVVMSVAAGCAFGSIFILLRHSSDGSGMWPVVAMRAASVPYMMVVMYVTKQTIAGVRRHKTVVLGSGILDSLANALYLAAVRHGLMSIVAVIISLYPASTLMLATGLDKEKVHRSQGIGLGVAAVALVLIMLA